MAALKLTAYVAGQRSTALDTTNGQTSLVTGADEKAQRVRKTLQHQLGSNVYKRNGGAPWREIVFAETTTEFGVAAAISAVVRNVSGISTVLECTVNFDDSSGSRVAQISGVALDEDSNSIPFGIQVAQ